MAGRARAILNGSSFIPFSVGGTAATLDMDFRNGGYRGATPSDLTVTRSGIASSGLSTDATGSSYTMYAPNTPRIVSGQGLRVEETRTQYLGVTDTPATQTTASLGTGTYTLWVIGSGSATPSGGTATITGAAAATAGSPNTFTVTVAGTVTVTVSGSLTRFQLENGASPTSYIPNLGAAGTTVVRSLDAVTIAGGAFSSWYTGGSSGTMFVDAILDLSQNNGFPGLMAVDDGTTNNAMHILFNNSTNVSSFEGYSGGATQFALGGVALTGGISQRFAMAYATNDAAAFTNGTSGGTDATVTVPTPTLLRLGALRGGTNISCSFIRRIAYFPARLSNAQLQALTS